MKKQIKTIVIEEFSKVIDSIENDFSKNYKNKTNNFLLSQMDKRIMANMVLLLKPVQKELLN